MNIALNKKFIKKLTTYKIEQPLFVNIEKTTLKYTIIGLRQSSIQ